MRIWRALVTCLLLILTMPTGAENTKVSHELKLLGRAQVSLPDPELSTTEWNWLRKKRTLHLGTDAPNYPPFDMTSGINDYGGINADYLALITEALNLNVSVLYFPNNQTMIEALEAGKIDLIANASNVDKRNENLLLSEPYVTISPVLIKRESDLDVRGSEPPKIALEKIFADDTEITKQFSLAHFVRHYSPRRALEALSFRELDGYIGDSTTAQYLINQANLINLQVHPLTNKQNDGFSFASTRKNQQLITIINKMLRQVPGNVKIDILRRWSGGIPLSLSDKTLKLTPLEQKWITTHPRIIVAVTQDFAPLSFFDADNRYRGLTADLLDAISARTGLKFKIKNVGTLREALESTQRGDADIAVGVTQDSIWPNGLLTTRTYLFNSWVLVARKNTHVQPKKIALQTGHPMEVFLQEHYPEAHILQVEMPRDGLDLVVQGKADTMVLPLIAADFLLSHYYANSLEIISSLDTEPARFALGVSPDAYPLVTILDKAMLNIQPEDLHALTSNWYSTITLREKERPAHTYTSLLLRNDLLTAGVIGLSLIAVLLFIYRHRRQQRLIGELMLAREQADSASRAKTIFLATMSHEIRTPMSAIIGSLELVLRRRKADAEDWQALQRSYDCAHSLLALIGDILDIARIESDRLVLHPQRACIRQLIESTAAMFDGLAREKALDFRLEIDAEIQGDVMIDPLRFKQILSNLFSNAVKFTAHGTIVTRVIHERRKDDSLGIRIEVQDSGCGISSGMVKNLFQPFSQASPSQNGSGLGLYICRSLARMMGGEITLKSEPGSGTTVILTLAVSVLAPLSLVQSQSISAPTERTRPLTILIAEDHPAGRHVLEQQLMFLGHHIRSVSDGEQALQALSEETFDLVITDCNMPRLNGYHFTEQLRQREQASDAVPTPVWGLTAAAQPWVREECHKSGMDDCLFKPVTLNSLAEKLQPLTTRSDQEDMTSVDFCLDKLPAELSSPNTQQAFLSLLAVSLREELGLLNTWQSTSNASLEELQSLLHRIRGGVRFIGAEVLCQQCLAIEMSASRPSLDQVCEVEKRLKLLLATIEMQITRCSPTNYK